MSEEKSSVFGLHKDQDECDRIYVRLPSSLRESDTYLYGLKWFDYRFTHDVHATYLFADAYCNAYRDCFRRNVDANRAEFVKGIKSEEIFDFSTSRTNELTGLYKARQWADALTMPYDVFCRLAMFWAMRRTRKFIPRPTHLYSFDLLAAVKESWVEEQKVRHYVSTDPRYKNQAYQGLRYQDDHHQWLLEQATLRPNPRVLLANVVFRDFVLLESKARARFGDVLIDEIQASS